jgi:hypothetical protein
MTPFISRLDTHCSPALEAPASLTSGSQKTTDRSACESRVELAAACVASRAEPIMIWTGWRTQPRQLSAQ